MFGKILGKDSKKTEESEVDQEIVNRISKMNLSDMRIYVNNGLKDHQICVDGLYHVMKKLIEPVNDKGEYYIKEDDMDSKKKKAFDLVLLIATSKKISITTVELIEKFIDIYNDILFTYDLKYKDIYEQRLRTAIETALINVQTLSDISKKLDVLK